MSGVLGPGEAVDLGDGSRQTKVDGGALALLALYPQGAAVGFDQGPGDGQTQSAASCGARAGLVGSVKPLADAGQILSRDADALILHLDHDRLIQFSLDGDRDRTSGLGVLDGVVQEVVDCQEEQVRVIGAPLEEEHHLVKAGGVLLLDELLLHECASLVELC